MYKRQAADSNSTVPPIHANDALAAKQAPPTATAPSAQTEIGGLNWTIPAAWENVGKSGMRIAEYKIPGATGAAPGASIRFFSTQGTAQANIDRWKTQVKDPTDGPTTKTIESGPLKAHTIAMTGAYAGMGPSGTPMPPQANTRFLAAFIEGGTQPVQVVIFGPDDLVRGMEVSWEEMLAKVK